MLHGDRLDGASTPGSLILLTGSSAPAGARAVGLWPSSDPYEALVTLLERRSEVFGRGDPLEVAQGPRPTIAGLGKDVGTNLVAGVLVELGRAGL